MSKLSEKYLQRLHLDLTNEQGIVIEEIKTYGEICKIEAKLDAYNSMFDFVSVVNEARIIEDKIDYLTDKLNKIKLREKL